MKTETRNILDRGGTLRTMQLIYSKSGTMIYAEIGSAVVAAFLEYDSLDASAIWADDLDRLADDHPHLKPTLETIKGNR